MEAKKIFLIVDDDADDRELLLDAITEIDDQVSFQIAVNGLEALNLLQEIKHDKTLLPRLIILDLNMPYLDGKSVFEKIKNDPLLEHIPIIVFSSSNNPSDRAFFENRKINYYSKPFDYSDMKSIVKRMLVTPL